MADQTGSEGESANGVGSESSSPTVASAAARRRPCASARRRLRSRLRTDSSMKAAPPRNIVERKSRRLSTIRLADPCRFMDCASWRSGSRRTTRASPGDPVLPSPGGRRKPSAPEAGRPHPRYRPNSTSANGPNATGASSRTCTIRRSFRRSRVIPSDGSPSSHETRSQPGPVSSIGPASQNGVRTRRAACRRTRSSCTVRAAARASRRARRASRASAETPDQRAKPSAESSSTVTRTSRTVDPRSVGRPGGPEDQPSPLRILILHLDERVHAGLDPAGRAGGEARSRREPPRALCRR